MKCPDYRSGLIELARGAALEPGERGRLRIHLGLCEECVQFFDDQMALSAAARIVESDAAMMQAPQTFEAALLAEFASVHRKKRWLARGWAPLGAGALAASLALAWYVAHPFPNPPGKTVPVQAAKPVQATRRTLDPGPAVQTVAQTKKGRRPHLPAPEMARTADPEAPFLQIPYTLPLAPYERASVMRVEMPVSALIAAGLQVATANTGALAEADVVVGEDGRARAFRVISILADDSERSIRR